MYTLVIKRGKVELELTTNDKETIVRQLELTVGMASNIKVNTEPKEPAVKEFKPEDVVLPPQPHHEDIVESNQEVNEQPQENNVETVENLESQQNNTEPETQNETVEETIIPTGIPVTSYKPNTINSIQNPEPPSEPDFDAILNTEMQQDNLAPITKDQKFIEFVESKSAIEKLDFLVVTAQYLAQYENMNTFNLKHVNAKLMQNFTLIVDHSILQSAISREYITQIQSGSDESSGEYMLTEKGLRSY